MQYIKKEKLDSIKLNKNNFYLALDFDKTITAANSSDSWDAVTKYLGDEFRKESDEQYKKYRPIELDYKIKYEEKYKCMEEWYNSIMGLYYKYHLTYNQMADSINISNLIFREGAKEFLTNMHRNNIPIVILSAGIGNTIEQFLKNNNCYFDNMHIISNFLRFDEEGNIKTNRGNDIIHTLNKTMEGHVSTDFINEIEDKKYRLLIGDLVEDKNMIPKTDFEKTIYIRIFK